MNHPRTPSTAPRESSPSAPPPVPAPESRALAEAGFADWASKLPPYDDDFTDVGTPIRWVPGVGWVEGSSCDGAASFS